MRLCLTKFLFSVVYKHGSYAATMKPCDEVIKIDHFECKVLSKGGSNDRLACAHKANYDDVCQSNGSIN